MSPALFPSAPASLPSAKARHAPNNFHAVSIRPADKSCEGARRIQSMRYLSAQAPQVPLAECNASRCECRYVHYEDRRSSEERRDACTAPALELSETRVLKQRRAPAVDPGAGNHQTSWSYLSR
jgi:hypothetical protein